MKRPMAELFLCLKGARTKSDYNKFKAEWINYSIYNKNNIIERLLAAAMDNMI